MGLYKNKIDEHQLTGNPHFRREVLEYMETPSKAQIYTLQTWQELINLLGDPNKPINGRSKRFIIQPDGGRWQVLFMNDRTYFYLDELVEGPPEWKEL